MPTMFHDVRLPEDIEQGAQGGPTFYTNVTSISSGAEQRTIGWDRPRVMWQLGYGIQTKDDYQTILAFFYARQGRAYGFRFKDHSDYSAEDAVFGTGDATNRVFRLVKPYESGDTTYNRIITHPVVDTVVLMADGVVISAALYDIEDYGIVRFHVGQAPANGVELTWDGEFDVPVRFDVDEFNVTLAALANGEMNNALPIIELREQINNPPTDIIITTTYHASLDETQDTSARIALADFDIVDDDLGVNAIGLAGANPSYFEVELDAGTRSGTLYLTAGILLNYESVSSLSVDIETWDTIVGARPSATRTVTLAINNIAEPPVVTLSNETHALVAGTSTASRVHLADIAYTVDSGQSVAFTLTGADASHFEYFGGNVLYLKAGEDTASVHHYTDLQIVATPSVAAATVVPFVLTIGIVPLVTIYDTPGTYTYTVAEYGTLELDVWAAGNATWGYTPGTPTVPTAPGRTYVQNDQTVTLEHRWRVEPFRMTDNPDAWTPGYKIATATMDSLGIGAALTASNPGNVGGTGITPATKATDFDAPSGGGGYQVDVDATVKLGGAIVRAAEPGDGLVTTADGLPGTTFGTGASGGVFKKNTITPGSVTLGTTPPNSLTFTSMAGAGSGHFAKFTWTYGTIQVGTGAGYKAPAPAVGDILTIVIGTGGVKGLGTVNGANGSPGRVRISRS